MNNALPRNPSRREFLVLSGVTAATVALVDAAWMGIGAAATTPGCTAGTCMAATAWMLDPDWGYPRGPHDKTRLVSRASRGAAANRIARTEGDALDMNLHLCSWAPAVSVPMCATQVEAAFDRYATTWVNPWNGATVSLLDMRSLPADDDLFTCPASLVTQPSAQTGTTFGAQPLSGPTDRAELAFTGSADRRLLFAGVGALLAGTILRRLSQEPERPATGSVE